MRKIIEDSLDLARYILDVTGSTFTTPEELSDVIDRYIEQNNLVEVDASSHEADPYDSEL